MRRYIFRITEGYAYTVDILIKKAITLGFTNAVWLNGVNIACDAALRAYCNPEGCPNHGQNWVCPPGCGSLEACAERVSRYREGILLQSVTALSPPVAGDTYKTLSRAHNLRLKKLLETMDSQQFDMLALTTGGCIFCDTCAYPLPCLRPDVRMNSLSAYGIDVGKLCEQAGLQYAFRPDRVYYTALVLIKERTHGKA